MLIAVPSVLMILLRYVLDDPVALNRFACEFIGVFPFIIMFIITALASSPDPAPLTGLVTVTPDIREGPRGPCVTPNSRQSGRPRLRTKAPGGQPGRPLSSGSHAPSVGTGGAMRVPTA